jgi:hypothetical protein
VNHRLTVAAFDGFARRLLATEAVLPVLADLQYLEAE